MLGPAGVLDGRDSAIPFVRELGAYLAHCEREGGLTLAETGGRFPRFFELVNTTIVESAFQRTGVYKPDTSFSRALAALRDSCAEEPVAGDGLGDGTVHEMGSLNLLISELAALGSRPSSAGA